MDYFTIISTVAEIFIALVALVIAIFQAKNERIQRKQEALKEKELKEKQELLEKLSSATSEIVKPIEAINEFSDGIKTFHDEALVQHIVNGTNEIINQEVEFYEKIYVLYADMLRNETVFSMSYGFERYIISFRNYIQCDQVINSLTEKYKNLIGYIETHRESFSPAELSNLVNEVLAEINNIIGYNKEILPICRELQLKYQSGK